MANFVTFKQPTICGESYDGYLYASNPPMRMYGVLHIPENEVAISYDMYGKGFELLTSEAFSNFKKELERDILLRTCKVSVSEKLVQSITEYLETSKLQAGKVHQLFVAIASEKETYFGTEHS